MCDTSKIVPIFLSLYRVIPTVAKINRGPELFVKDINLSASVLEIRFSLFKSQTTFAPIG